MLQPWVQPIRQEVRRVRTCVPSAAASMRAASDSPSVISTPRSAQSSRLQVSQMVIQVVMAAPSVESWSGFT